MQTLATVPSECKLLVLPWKGPGVCGLEKGSVWWATEGIKSPGLQRGFSSKEAGRPWFNPTKERTVVRCENTE